jgi:cytochrome c-type biogenesis protein CcmE
VQVTGSWDKSQNYTYDAESNTFTFVMKDEAQKTSKVVYKGAKPNNFDIAPMVVIKGQFEGDTFIASEILTKCPSKYEADFEEIKKNTKV